MASFSSDTDRLREMNSAMTGRLLDAPAQPLTEGGYALRVLETRGRVTGEARRTPVGVLQRDDRQYLISPDPARDWVRNLRNDPRCAILAGPQRWARHATQVGGDEAAGAVGGYLSVVTAPWALRAFPVAPGAPRAEIVAHLDSLAVFRLDGADD